MTPKERFLSRREFLKAAGLMTVGAAAAACAPTTPAPTPVPPTPTPAAAAPTTAPTPTAPAIKGGPLEVGVFYEEGPWFDLVKEIGDQLEKDFPGTKVKYTFANTATDSARALRWEAGDPLDVDTAKWNAQGKATWSYADNDMLLDLTPYLEEPLPSGEKWMDIYAPITRSFAVDQRPDSKTSGRWLGVPAEVVLMLIHYNQRAFDEMGVEPAKTWPEFLDLCATIYEKGKPKGMKPICVSGPTDIYVGHWWDRMIQRMVGRKEVEKVIFGDGHLRDNPGFLAAAKEIEKIPQNDWLMDGYEGADFTAAQAMFFQGKAAMIHMGTWLVGEMADVLPEDFVVGTFDFPTVPEGKGDQKAMFGTSHIFSVPNPKISKSHEVNVPLAIEYLKRFCGREASAKRAQVLGSISPCTKVPAPPRLPGVDKIIEAAGETELIIYYYGIHWDTALWAAWYPPVQALWLKKITAEQMIEQIDENLDKYRAMKAATPTP